MAVASSRTWNFGDDWWPTHDTVWRERISNERNWDDWPRDWPRPREIVPWFRHNSDRWWRDWPADWPRMDTIMPRFTSHLERFDPNWRFDPFWRDLYPRWAEPLVKEGVDIKATITNDSRRFAVELDTTQFRPEELQVKTMDDTLLIEGRHEAMKDRDNFTRMYFVRKYQLPPDVEPQDVTSSIDSRGRLVVEAAKRALPYDGRERNVPIAGGYSSRGYGSEAGRDGVGFDSQYRGGQYLSPQKPEDRNYRSGYSSQETDADGMRHESHREEFREVHRAGSRSPHSMAPVQTPAGTTMREENYRSESRQSGFHRSGSSSRNDFWPSNRPHFDSPIQNHSAGVLRPAEEINGAGDKKSESYRNIQISRTYS